MNDHPPLNTPLSAFTPEMLDALPVGSAFGPGDWGDGDLPKQGGGWDAPVHERGPDDVMSGSGNLRYYADNTRPLIRVGPEQAASHPDGHDAAWCGCAECYQWRASLAPKFSPREPAPLPDPWPGMLVEVQADSVDEWDRGAIRRAYRARHGTMYVHVEGLENPVKWHAEEIREVRTPDGVTVWKRAKVTT